MHGKVNLRIHGSPQTGHLSLFSSKITKRYTYFFKNYREIEGEARKLSTYNIQTHKLVTKRRVLCHYAAATPFEI